MKMTSLVLNFSVVLGKLLNLTFLICKIGTVTTPISEAGALHESVKPPAGHLEPRWCPAKTAGLPVYSLFVQLRFIPYPDLN